MKCTLLGSAVQESIKEYISLQGLILATDPI